jgi:hypothetical protein
MMALLALSTKASVVVELKGTPLLSLHVKTSIRRQVSGFIAIPDNVSYFLEALAIKMQF